MFSEPWGWRRTVGRINNGGVKFEVVKRYERQWRINNASYKKTGTTGNPIVPHHHSGVGSKSEERGEVEGGGQSGGAHRFCWGAASNTSKPRRHAGEAEELGDLVCACVN
mgnify:CR=1 FL=1|jgi:hypothetical protein